MLTNFIKRIAEKILNFFIAFMCISFSILFFIVALIFLIQGATTECGILMLLCCSFALIGRIIYKKKLVLKEDKPHLLPHNFKKLTASQLSDFHLENYKKAVEDYNSLNNILPQINEPILRRQLEKIQAIAHKILLHLEAEPQSIPLAEKFISYYQDKALTLTRKFQELESFELDTPEINKLKRDILSTLSSFDEAYQAQFSHMLSKKIMETDAEIKITNHIMAEEGIYDSNAPMTEDIAEEPANKKKGPNGPFGRFQH